MKLNQATNHLNLKLLIGPELLGTKMFLATIPPKISQRKNLWLILCWKLILGWVKFYFVFNSSKLVGTLTNLLKSSLSTSAFKAIKSLLAAKLDVSSSAASFDSF